MKEFKFDHQGKSWDRYKSFHNKNGGIVEFETGEVMVSDWRDVYDRRMYHDYGIQLVATTDKECPQLFLDKECTEPVKKAWVTHHGMQELAIDWEQKVAVRLIIQRGSSVLGNHVQNASAYWAGAKRLPVPLGKILVQTPNPEYKKVLSPIIVGEVLPAITAMHKMDSNKRGYGSGKYLAKEKWLDSSAQEIVADICDTNDWSLSGDLRQIATNGFEYPRATSHVDFLYTKGEE
jgi:hypothetical protein